MTYRDFQESQKTYLETVTPQGKQESIPLIPEKDYGESFTTVLIDSDRVQEDIDILRACAEIDGVEFNEQKEKASLIAENLGDLTQEARKEYNQFIPAQNPEMLFNQLSSFYKNGLTDKKDLKEDYQSEAGQEKIKAFFNTQNLAEYSEIEQATALVAIEKTTGLFRNQNLRNTDTVANYHAIFVENKAANPYGFYASRIASLPEETKAKLQPFAEKLLPVTHDGGAWHEMIHTLGTEDETKCEGFRFLKTLQTYQEPALIYPDINARLYNNLNTLETIRKEEQTGNRTLEGNFRYIMPKMLHHIMENAESLTQDLSAKSDAEIMQTVKEFSETLSYSKETENAFRTMAKECASPEELSSKLKEAYQNGRDDKKTGIIFDLVNDFVETAHYLNPSLSKQETSDLFFSPERFKSQKREAGKIEIKSQEDFTLTPQEEKHFQALYDQTKKENPSVSGHAFDKLFATKVVQDSWETKRQKESELETPKTAQEVLFSQQHAAQYTTELNRTLMTARNAGGIVSKYSAEFEKGKYRPQSLQDKIKASTIEKKSEKSSVHQSNIALKQRQGTQR